MGWLDHLGCGGREPKEGLSFASRLGAPRQTRAANSRIASVNPPTDGRQVAERLRNLAQEHKLSVEAEEAVKRLIEEAQGVEVPHEYEGPKPLLHMPVVRQRHGEKQPEVHIGWADIYLDLILVGVAFNGGLLLKHAFYLCTPVGAHDVSHGHETHRMLSGHHHPPCYGLLTGNLHVLAFGVPLMGAWFKDTIFRARFESNSLISRSLDVASCKTSPQRSNPLGAHTQHSPLRCLCALLDWLRMLTSGRARHLPAADLLMIVAASCEEDVAILEEDASFWKVCDPRLHSCLAVWRAV